MVEIAPAIRNSIAQFVVAVQAHYDIRAVYLYGSYAKGTATEWSDIDLALISPMFSNDRFNDQVTLMRLAVKIDDRIEPHPFTEETFTVNNPLVYEIQCHGIRFDPPNLSFSR
jgi:predicted nucleotidyltransferase